LSGIDSQAEAVRESRAAIDSSAWVVGERNPWR